jgi:predicted CXXCH cytochrome family protein
MAPQETGKQRAARIPLDYYKDADLLESWKLRLAGIALLISLGWAGIHFALGGQRHFQASRGPLAGVHQVWDAQCNACHMDFTPISSNSWAPFFLHSPTDSSAQCQNCHAGTAHHDSQKPDLTCGTCHREHRGPDASLLNLADQDCTRCHKDLGNHMDVSKAWHTNAGAKEFDKKVSSFVSKHPEFRSLDADPGKLKFSHKRHLTPGMAFEKGDEVMTLGRIPEAFRERYRSQQEKKEKTDPVVLQCASCHQLDTGDFKVDAKQAQGFPFTVQGQRKAGAYMVPIIYENQCQACHPLEHMVDTKTWTVPHRLVPAEIHRLLDHFFTAQLARGIRGFLKQKGTRPLPFQLTPLDQRKLEEQEAIAQCDLYVEKEIDNKARAVERDLFLGKQSCALCHYFEGPQGKTPADFIGRPNFSVVPTNVPQVWFKHAKFNHTSHRAMSCESCHAGVVNSMKETDVLIPKREKCLECHAPTTNFGTPGARFSCTECHLYHNGDNNLQGVGAAKRNPKEAHDAFMRGH